MAPFALRYLRAFVVAAEEQHVGRAAQVLGITQPALSRQIGELESRLGVQLFERRARGIRLTDAGRHLLERAPPLIEALDRTAEETRRIGRGQDGRLAIGYVESTVFHGIVPTAIRRFVEGHPAVTLDLKPALSIQQLEAIRAGRLDVGFLYNRPADEVMTRSTVVAEHDVVLALPEDHPLAARARLTPSDLRGQPFVAFPRGDAPRFHDCIMGGLRAIGIEPDIRVEAANLLGILGLVAAGMGVAVVNAEHRWCLPTGVVLRPVEGLAIPLRLEAVWRIDRTTPALLAFLAIVRDLARRAPPAAARPAARRVASA